jgi:alpha-tubulin suppressor-like RCC1 family protein
MCGATTTMGNRAKEALTTITTAHPPQTLCPVPFPMGSAVVQLSAGSSLVCALVQGGAVYCWGFGTNGQLGVLPTPNYLMIPTLVSGLSSVTISVISAGNAQVYAVSTGGTIYQWGGNGNCEGLSTTTYYSPMVLTALTNEALLSQGGMAQGGCIVAH